MSDENDHKFHFVLVQLLASYALLGRLLLELPVPVQLPTGVIESGEMRAALIRAAQLAEEQPMPEPQQFQMEHACLLWIAADRMLSAFFASPEDEHLIAAAAHCIAASDDAALDFGEWLVRLEKPEQPEA
ncbi:hypothetical protein [Streptacidiphilus albus]|uniref:hypothetical protein n=1 Tax=Streptacidiphilus albus TaxID=105425 RepID=UPI00054B915F|nr:hypothetical protein [Streptacidiphilus albus]